MANPPMTAEQMQQNLADLTAQNQSILANIQHSNAVGAANEAASMAQTDAFISALEGGGAPGGFAPGMPGPQVEGYMPPGGPMMDGQHPPMIMDGLPANMLDGQTPGLVVHQSMHHDTDGGGDNIIESLLGFDLDGDGDAGGAHHAGDVHSLEDAVHLAQETGQVVVIEEVIVIEPGHDAHDHSGGDFSL